MAINVEYWSKDEAIQYWSLHLRENSSLERKAQTKQTNKSILTLIMKKFFSGQKWTIDFTIFMARGLS